MPFSSWTPFGVASPTKSSNSRFDFIVQAPQETLGSNTSGKLTSVSKSFNILVKSILLQFESWRVWQYISAPPITKVLARGAFSLADWREGTTRNWRSLFSAGIVRDTTMFRRSLSGRKISGMLSHVFRPMMTEFLTPGSKGRGVLFVTLAKYAISFFNVHGKVPFSPIPMELAVAATMIVKSGRCMIGGNDDDDDKGGGSSISAGRIEWWSTGIQSMIKRAMQQTAALEILGWVGKKEGVCTGYWVLGDGLRDWV